MMLSKKLDQYKKFLIINSKTLRSSHKVVIIDGYRNELI